MKVKRRRFAEMARQNAAPVKPRPGRCNYPLDNGARFCKAPSGAATTHPGSGYCSKHDNAAYDPIHRYRNVKNPALQKKMAKLDGIERDVFDLIPEIQLMRTLLIDYIDRFYTWQEELHAWFLDQGKSPKRMMDLTESARLVKIVGELIERQQRLVSKDSITLETFRRITEAMGIIVARHVREGKALEAIERDWSMLDLDSKAPVVPIPESTATPVLTDGHDRDED